MKQSRDKRAGFSTIFFVIVFFIGLSVLLYPTFSNYYNSFHQTRAIASYNEAVAKISDSEYATLLSQADHYNQTLLSKADRFKPKEQELDEYKNLLNIEGDGIMGYIEIKKIGVSLPIYHTVDNAVLQTASGHIPGSSLPVGGAGTHAALSGHRGLPSAKLFTDLDRLEVGDTWVVTVLNQMLTYEVDKISIVLPEDMSGLAIDPDQDYMTLVTCTPYGINTHRLLVRGKRIENEATKSNIRIVADAVQIDPILVAPLVAAPILLILLILLLTAPIRRKKSTGAEETGRSTVTEQKNDSISPKDGGTE